MGKRLISLLILVISEPGLNAVFASANEQTRQVQGELRKRHLFYQAADGEVTPALTVAIKRYQQRMGLAATGLLDPETLASLGLSNPPPPAEGRVTLITGKGRETRGPNGELLPPSFAPDAERTESTFALGLRAETNREIAALNSGLMQRPAVPVKRRSQVARRSRPRQETNPIVLGYRTIDRAMRNLFGQPSPGNKARRPGSANREPLRP